MRKIKLKGVYQHFKGKYYIVETQAGPGYLIPSALSKANGGKQITCDTTKTINLP